MMKKLAVMGAVMVLGFGSLLAQDIQSAGQIAVGSYPRGIAVTPDGRKGYVPDISSGQVYILDLSTQTVTNILSAGSGARTPVMSPDGRHVYVLTSPDVVIVIEVASDVIVGRIHVPIPPSNIAFSSDGATAVLYVLSAASANYVSVVDTTTFTVVAQVPMPATSYYNGFAISPDNKYLMATTAYPADPDDYVTVVDVATLTLVKQIVVGSQPMSLAFNSTGTKAYVGNYSSASVSVVDMASLSVTTQIPMANRPYRVRTGTSGSARYVWAIGDQAEGVGVIDTQTDQVVTTIPVAGIAVPVNDIAFRSDGRAAVVTSAAAGTANLVDAYNGNASFATVLMSIATGGKLTTVVFSKASDMAYVIDERYGLVLCFSVTGGKEPPPPPVVEAPALTLRDAIAQVLDSLKAYRVTAKLGQKARKDLDQAIGNLEGNHSGAASNGALTKLDAGSLHDALVKVGHSMKDMMSAVGFDVTAAHKKLAEGSKTDTKKALTDRAASQVAWDLFNAGVQAMDAGEYIKAVRLFRWSLNPESDD